MNTATQLPSLKRIAIVLFLVLLTPLLTACEEGSDLFFDMAFEWAQGKELITCSSGDSDDCDLNWAALGGYWLGVGSDAGVQAMVDTGLVVRDINTADALADEGFATGDIQKLQEASKIRPNNWSYDQQISVLHLSQGDIQESRAAQLDADAQHEREVDGVEQRPVLEQADHDSQGQHDAEQPGQDRPDHVHSAQQLREEQAPQLARFHAVPVWSETNGAS